MLMRAPLMTSSQSKAALFGETNRWGKLPLTVYPAAYASELTIQDMAMRANASTGYPGRGYRYYTGQALFEFGEGLSYTSFSTNCSGGETGVNVTAATINCTVTNTGDRAGDEVVLLFHRPPATARHQPQRPIRRLLDFTRVSLRANQSVGVSFVVDAVALALPSEAAAEVNNATVYPGNHLLEISSGGGGQQQQQQQNTIVWAL